MTKKIIPKDDLFTGILAGEFDYLFGITEGIYRNTKAKFLVSVSGIGEEEVVECSPIAVFMEKVDLDECQISDGSDILILYPDSMGLDEDELDDSPPTKNDIIN